MKDKRLFAFTYVFQEFLMDTALLPRLSNRAKLKISSVDVKAEDISLELLHESRPSVYIPLVLIIIRA